MNKNNVFIKLDETVNGRVSVKLQKNQLSKGEFKNFFGRVERNTYSTQNVLDLMKEAIPLVDLGTAASVLTAYSNTILKIIESGNAVKFGELGTFYIAGKGTVDNEDEKPSDTVKFTVSEGLKNAVSNIEIASSEYTVPAGKITRVTDIATGNKDGILTSVSSILVEGENLKIGGEGAGIWFVPVTEKGVLYSDEAEWIKVQTALVYNLPSKLLFTVPENVESGNYKIVVRTRYGSKPNYIRKNFIEAVSDIVIVE